MGKQSKCYLAKMLFCFENTGPLAFGGILGWKAGHCTNVTAQAIDNW